MADKTNKLSAKPSYKPIIQQSIIKPPTKQVPSNNGDLEIKRQKDECLSEINNLESIEIEFKENYHKKIKDIEKQLKSIYDAVKKRELDLKNWRKKEYDEGMNEINQNKEILQKRLNELNAYESKQRDTETLYKVPQLNDFYLHQFSCQSLQIQNALNIIFQIGPTHQQNNNNINRKFISFTMNTNAANKRNHIESQMNKHKLDFSDSPFGKGKICTNTATRAPKTHTNNVQQNGTKALQHSQNKESAIRAFDIGNNAKYADAQQMAKNTNALPTNFWESESDTDSEEEQKETQRDIVNRWKTQKSNIAKIKHAPAQRTQHVYDDDTSSEEDDENDGFKKYVAPKAKQTAVKPEIMDKKNSSMQWIVEQRQKTHTYDTMWFKLPKMRNGKANGRQMKPYLEKSGLSKQTLKEIWRLSDLDKDGKMGNEEFVLCM